MSRKRLLEAKNHTRLYYKENAELINKTLSRIPDKYLEALMYDPNIKHGRGVFVKYDGYQFIVHRNNLNHEYNRRHDLPNVVKLSSLEKLGVCGLTNNEIKTILSFIDSNDYKSCLENDYKFCYGEIDRFFNKKCEIHLCFYKPYYDYDKIRRFDFEI